MSLGLPAYFYTETKTLEETTSKIVLSTFYLSIAIKSLLVYHRSGWLEEVYLRDKPFFARDFSIFCNLTLPVWAIKNILDAILNNKNVKEVYTYIIILM